MFNITISSGWIGLGLALVSPLAAAPMSWRTAIGTDGVNLKGKSSFVAVKAMPPSQPGEAAQAFLAGNVKDAFQFAGLPVVDVSKDSGVVVKVRNGGMDSWSADWQAWAQGEDTVTFTDMAVSPLTGWIYVCGNSGKAFDLIDATTGNKSQTLPEIKDVRGFVAWLNPTTGAWLGGFRSDGIRPVSLAIAADGSITLTGEGALAKKFTAAGQPVWTAPTPLKLEAWSKVATGAQPNGPVYVMYEDKDSPTKEDVVISQLNPATGSVTWSKRMGSSGDDFPGGLAVGTDGKVTLSFSAKATAPMFGGAPVAMPKAVEATHALIARVNPDSSLVWVRPLGAALISDSALFTKDIDLDPSGTAWICGQANGPWTLASVAVEYFTKNSVLLAVSPTGSMVSYERSLGEANDAALAVSAASSEMVVVAGKYSKGLSYLPTIGQAFTGLVLNPRGKENGGFFAVLNRFDWGHVAPENDTPLRWRKAIGTDGKISKGTSSFIGVKAVDATPDGQLARSFMAGNIKDEFQFPGLPPVVAAKQQGIMVRAGAAENGNWSGVWQALARADEDVVFTDMAMSPVSGAIYVCGTAKQPVELIDASGTKTFTLPTSRNICGFVAWLDPNTGAWLGGVRSDGIEPIGVAIGEDGGILVTGTGALAKKYSATGQALWTAATPLKFQAWAEIAIAPQSGGPVYVMYLDKDSQSEEDVVLSQLDPATGAVTWTVRMGSPGDDLPGGLAVGPDDMVTLSFSAKSKAPTFGGLPLAIPYPVEANHPFLIRLRPDSSLVWARPLAWTASERGSEMLTRDIDVSPEGTVWVCAWANGPWSLPNGENLFTSSDALLLGVDAAGELIHFSQGLGEAKDLPHAVSAPNSSMVVVVGEYSHGMTYMPASGTVLPFRDRTSGAFFALLRPSESQRLMVVRPNPNIPDTDMQKFVAQLFQQWSMSAYGSVENGDSGTAVSIWMTDADISTLSQNEWVIIEPEVEMKSNGTVMNPGWALARLNDSNDTRNISYKYADTTATVVLYLIDSAVANPNGWFNGNSLVNLEQSTLERGYGDPLVSSSFTHGTRMLSLVAGPQTGVAQGTPIRVINYDVFPNGETTTATLVAKGVVDAVRHHMADTTGQRGVICLATSSEAGATSQTLRSAIDMAVARGLTVIVSAGNLGGNASQYIPASYGTTPGVVCVGATDTDNKKLPMSNSGSAVDLYAPGEEVRVLNFDRPAVGSYDLMTGTSPAAALAAGAALAEVSGNPALTPADIESALKLAAAQPAIPLLQVSPLASPPGTTPPQISDNLTKTDAVTHFSIWASGRGLAAGTASMTGDPDGDRRCNLLEYFHGLDPSKSEGSVEFLGRDAASGVLSFTFPISAALFNPANPQVLLDGTTWKIETTADLADWATAAGQIRWSGPVDNLVTVTLETTPTTPSCFLRVNVTPAP